MPGFMRRNRSLVAKKTIGHEVVMLSSEVERVIQKALDIAKEKRQEFATLEHLCYVLFDSAKIRSLLGHLGVSRQNLKNRFLDFIDQQIESLPENIAVEPVLSLGFQRVLQRASLQVLSAAKEEVLVEHLLVATFDEEESFAVFMLKQAGLSRLDLVSVISHGDDLMMPLGGEKEEYQDEDGESPVSEQSLLARFTENLTAQAARGELDAVVGRKRELDRAVLVLSRRRKNNPLFVGEPGVGKTALAEGLALRIAQGDVPSELKNAEVFLLDMGAMLAGARYRGDFENRMKAVLKELSKKPNNIMVIDEIHTIVGAGATTGSSMDASNLLKPILSKGQLRCIGSTTYKEYRTYFEKDRALARRFQKIDVEEPSKEACIDILKGLKNRYESFHKVEISDEAIAAAVELSIRYLHERKLPDKAIDLIDEASAEVKLRAGHIVGKKEIEETIAKMAHIPSQNVTADDKTLLLTLEEDLKKNIFGQDEAINELTHAVLLSRSGLRSKEKPIGSFLFTGPSGVGKTETARQLAKSLSVPLIRFDMSEYMERHTASRLVGAPPGYVGYDQGGLLTDAIHQNPHAVLLLDEIEKAHPDVFNMLLQIMDYGKLTDSNGRPTDFRHTILIMTSNIGAFELEQNPIGFNQKASGREDEKAVKKLFTPEFRNRLDARIAFNKLSKQSVNLIIEKSLQELDDILQEKNVTFAVSDDATAWFSTFGIDPVMGARPLQRLIDREIKRPLAHELLFGKLSKGGKVTVNVVDNKIKLNLEPL